MPRRPAVPHPIQAVLSGLHLDDLDAILDQALFGAPLQEVEAEEVPAEGETRSEPPPVPPLPDSRPPAAVAVPPRAPTPAVPRRQTRRLSVLPSLVAEEELWLRRMQEERSQQQARAELLTLMPPPPEPAVAPAPAPVRHHRLPMVVGLLGPVTLGLALGAILMRLVVQPEPVRALEAPRQVGVPLEVSSRASPLPPVASVSVAPALVASPIPLPETRVPSVPVPAPPEIVRGPPITALPLVTPVPQTPMPARASVSVAPGALPGTHAVPLAPLRHKREPQPHPLPASGEARASGTLSDRDFDRAMGFAHAPTAPSPARGGARARATAGANSN